MLEQEVIAVVAAITKAPSARITPDTDLRVDLNVDSLQGLQIVAALEKRFNVELSDEDLDSYTSVRSICEAIRRVSGG
jgi:acyl carrier protein